MRRAIKMLLTEIERMENLSVWLYAKGEMVRSADQKNGAERLRVIAEKMQEILSLY